MFFFAASSVALLFFSPDLAMMSFETAGWLHLFWLGFVMTIIFGAMAQLVPVVLERGHAAVDLYYAIYGLLTIGIVMMVGGFWIAPSLLPFGGLLVLAAMVIFAIENLVTLRKSTLRTLTVSTVKWSNAYLLMGIVTGFVIALGMNGAWRIDAIALLRAHVFAVLGGYVMATIVGLSLILLPMFSLAHGFDERPIHRAFKALIAGVGAVFVGSLIDVSIVRVAGYFSVGVAIVLYLYQVSIIGRMRVRKEWDIWAKSMLFAFVTLATAVVSIALWFVFGSDGLLYAGVWFFSAGFTAFMIIGHLYKIVPFLVWFERFSPLVGKQKVPMLHEMYEKKEAEMTFWFVAIGVSAIGVALLFGSDTLFKAGASFMTAGALFLVMTMEKMLSFGKK